MQYRKQLNNSKQNTKNSSKRTNNNKSFEIRGNIRLFYSFID